MGTDNLRQEKGRSHCFHTPDVSTSTTPSTIVHDDVSAQRPCLIMSSFYNPSIQYDPGTDSRTNGHHYHVPAISSGTETPLSGKCQAGVIIDNEKSFPIPVNPRSQIYVTGIIVFIIGGSHPFLLRIDHTGKGQPYAGKLFFRYPPFS